MNSNDVKFIIKKENPPMVNELNNLKTSTWKKTKKTAKSGKPVNNSPKKLIEKNINKKLHSSNKINKKSNSNEKTIIYQKPINNSPKELIEKNIKKKLRNVNKTSKKSENNAKNDVITNFSNLSVACILDDLAYEWFKHEFNLISIGPYDWESTLSKQKPSFLFVQSAWRGNNEKWIYQIVNLNPNKNSPLKKLVKWCKDNNIPTVFWNKDDPYDFEYFIESAKLFDYIFTSDANCINKYKKRVGHDRVFTLPFAAQTKIHNPINKDKKRLGKVAFAGSWYGKGHENRKKDMEIVLKPALKYDVHIYNRHYKLNDNNFKYPAIYEPNIKGGLPYNEMNRVYKEYDIFLNVNTVQNSPTMFSCRVQELLGCGVPVISGYALGIEKMFPQIVKMSKSQEETEKHIKHLLNNKDLRDRLALLGIREIYAKHTYKHRIKFILDRIGIKYNLGKKAGVSFITCTMREEYIDNVFENYSNQNYPIKELIVVLNKNSMNIAKWKDIAKKYKDVRIFKLDENTSLGECLNFAVDKSKYNYISKFDDDDYYGPNFATDLMNAFEYSDADIVGKNSSYVYFEDTKTLGLRLPNKENSYTNVVVGATMIIKKKVFRTVKFPKINMGEDSEFIKDCLSHNFKLYSADRFNFLYIRRKNPNSHTWNVTKKELLGCSKIIDYKNHYKDHVTV